MAEKMYLVGFFCVFFVSGAISSLPSTGVPCYLHPSADGCHYRLKPDSDICTTPAQRQSLSKKILAVNRTLVSLEQQLIRLGIIPPDNVCSELPSVENGGVIYDDLNLAPGATGRYTCYEGYTLISFDQEGRFQYFCTEDGIWDGSVTTVPVKCQLSSERCNPPENITNGTVTYINDDSSNTFIGDVVSYSCRPGHDLNGPMERYCLKSGNWSGTDPTCVQNEDISENDYHSDEHTDDHKEPITIGSSVGSVLAVTVIIIVIVAVAVAVFRKRKPKAIAGADSPTKYSSFPYHKFEGSSTDSTEDKILGTTTLTKKPSIQVIKETAAAAMGRERTSGNRSYRSTGVVTVQDEDSVL